VLETLPPHEAAKTIGDSLLALVAGQRFRAEVRWGRLPAGPARPTVELLDRTGTRLLVIFSGPRGLYARTELRTVALELGARYAIEGALRDELTVQLRKLPDGTALAQAHADAERGALLELSATDTQWHEAALAVSPLELAP
jgi:hypothetical protein